jgi:hypothetical protein
MYSLIKLWSFFHDHNITFPSFEFYRNVLKLESAAIFASMSDRHLQSLMVPQLT